MMRSGDGESGVVMVLVMLVVVLLGTASVSIASAGRDTVVGVRLDGEGVVVQAALDGALATARHRLRGDVRWGGGTVGIGDCEVEVRVELMDAGHRVWMRARGAGLVRVAVVELGGAERPGGLPVVMGYCEVGGG